MQFAQTFWRSCNLSQSLTALFVVGIAFAIVNCAALVPDPVCDSRIVERFVSVAVAEAAAVMTSVPVAVTDSEIDDLVCAVVQTRSGAAFILLTWIVRPL